MKCEECHQQKPDVRRRLDPYAWEVFDEERHVLMCDDCEQIRARDA